MADEWDKYKVSSNKASTKDDWSQYEVKTDSKETPKKEKGSSIAIKSPMEIGRRIGESIGRPISAFNEKASGGARELIRSLGTGEDAVNAYMKGYRDPEKSENIQEGAIQGANDLMTRMGVDRLPNEEIPGIGNPQVIARQIGGVIPSAAGMLTDIATNPAELASIVAFQKFPTLLKQVAPELSTRIAQFFTKERSLKSPFKGKVLEPNTADVAKFREEIKLDTQEAAKTLVQQRNNEIAALRAKNAELNNGFKTKVKMLDGDMAPTDPNMETIPKVADSVTRTARKNFWPYAKDLSNRFGTAYQSAIRGQKVKTQELFDSLGRAIERDGFLKLDPKDWSTPQKQLYEYQQRIKEILPKATVQKDPTGLLNTQEVVTSGKQTLNMSEVDKELQNLLGYKKGKKYGKEEHILTLVREEVSNALGQASAKVNAVRKQFAPELQAKNEFINIVQPFNRSGEFDTTRGINFFSNYAKGSMTDPDQLRLLQVLQENKNFGSSFLKPLDNMALKRNTILRNQLDFEMQKPSMFRAIEEKYQKLGNTMKDEVYMQNEFLNMLGEKAAAKESLQSRIKNFAEGTVKGAGLAAGAGALVEGYNLLTGSNKRR